MNNNAVRTVSLRVALLVGMLVSPSARAADNPYAVMAPIDQYRITNRASEIALARTAAPSSISADASVLVLGKAGFETASTGKNGFVCLVERGWTASYEEPQFWNPKVRSPICFNPPAARTILPITLKRTELALAGRSKAEIRSEAGVARDKKELPPLEAGAMSYMMSPQGFLGDAVGHWAPHLMIYTPQTDAVSWGADLPGAPVNLNRQLSGAPDHLNVFMIPVGKWSDGTRFVSGDHH